MRQIQVGAFTLIAALLSACSGGQFSSEGSSAGSSPSANEGGQSPQLGDEGDAAKGGDAQTSSGASSTSGGAKSSAGTGSGGTSAAGGSVSPPTSGGNLAVEECVTGSVTFRMLPSAKLPHDYLCDAGCGTGWLTITDADGATAFSISPACGTPSCETCEVQTCGAAACLPTPLTAEGSELTWSGNYLAKDTCGAKLACQRNACVKPGKYRARACAAVNQGQSDYGCMPKEEQLCAETEFEFPSAETVQLTLEKR